MDASTYLLFGLFCGAVGWILSRAHYAEELDTLLEVNDKLAAKVSYEKARADSLYQSKLRLVEHIKKLENRG